MSQDVRIGKGFGYKTKSGKICMQKCFECGSENYAMAVGSGYCAFCGYTPNKNADLSTGISKNQTKDPVD